MIPEDRLILELLNDLHHFRCIVKNVLTKIALPIYTDMLEFVSFRTLDLLLAHRDLYSFWRIMKKTFFAVFFILLTLVACKQRTEDKNNHIPAMGSTNEKNLTLRNVRFIPQWMHQAQFAGVYVAQAKGMYKNYALNVEILSGGPNLPAADAIRDNKADICSMFLLSAMREYSKGNRVVNLAQVFQKSSLLLVAKKDKGINNISDINGKRIALWRSDFQEISLMFIKKYQLNVEIVPIDWSINLFMQDGVDLMNVMLYNEYNQLIQSGLNREELVMFPMSKNGFDIPEDGLYCTDEYWNQNPAICKDFADATMEGWMYAINNQDEAVAIVLDVMRRSHLAANRPHQEWMLSQLKESILYRQASIGKLRKPDFEMADNLLIQANIIETPIDYNSFTGAR